MRGTGVADGYIWARAYGAEAAKMSNASGSRNRLTTLRPGEFRVLPSGGARGLFRFAGPSYAAVFRDGAEQSGHSRRLQGAVEHRFERLRAGKSIGGGQCPNGNNCRQHEEPKPSS